MNRQEIMEILPHRDPFLLVDEIIELTSGVRAVGLFHVDDRLDALRGHFPGNPIMPGVLQVESLAQVGAVIILSMPEYAGKIALFGGIDKARFRKVVKPGDTLRLEVTMDTLRGSAGRGTAVATVDGKKTCEMSMLFMIGSETTI